MSARKVDVRGILERAGANPDAPEGSQAWALAQVDVVVGALIDEAKRAESLLREMADAGFGDPAQADDLRIVLARIGGAA